MSLPHKEKTTKYCLEGLHFYDKEGIEKRLVTMAAQGWRVEQPGNFVWRYRRTEPSKCAVCVTYFPDATILDPEPSEEQRRREEYTKQDGWELTARWGQLQIYYNDRPDPTPIDTEPLVQVETMRRAILKQSLVSQVVLLLLCAMQLCMSVSQFQRHPVEYLAKPIQFYMLPFWGLLILEVLIEIITSLLWLRRARRAAEQGEFLPYRPQTLLTWSLLGVVVTLMLVVLTLPESGTSTAASLLWIVFYLMMFASVCGLRNHLRRIGAPRAVNLLAIVVATTMLTVGGVAFFTKLLIGGHLPGSRKPVGEYTTQYGWTQEVYQDPLPLTLQQLGVTADVAWSCEAERTATVLLVRTEYRQWPLTEDRSIPDLAYTVTEVRVPALYSWCEQALLAEEQDEREPGGYIFINHYEPTDPAPWGAQAAYQLHFSEGAVDRYLLCYPTCFVELRLEEPPTAAQQAAVAATFGG